MTNQRAVIGGNQPPPFEVISGEIADLYQTAKDFCDGEPIGSQAMHDEIEKLHDMLAEAGKRADALRIAEKKPLDDQIAEIQTRYNTLIGDTKTVKGKVVLGKQACVSLLTPWRVKVQKEKAEEARLAREEADRLTAAATAALRASSGNLAEREVAESLVQEAKKVERFAKKADKAATTKTGLATTWVAELVDLEAALDWAFGKDKAAFEALAVGLANTAARGGARSVPGFRIVEVKEAR